MADGSEKNYMSNELQQMIEDVKAAKNTRKFWACKGANLRKACYYTDKGLEDEIEKKCGEVLTAREAAEKYGYIIVTVVVGKERLPILDKDGNATIIDTDPAYTGTADEN